MCGDNTTIKQAPTTQAPGPGESAGDLYKARLEYDPQVAEMEQNLAQQYQPQQAQLQADLYGQYAPQLAGLQDALRQMYSPTQAGVTEQVGQIAQQRLANPFGYTPQEQEAVTAGRGGLADQLREQLRTRANLGGGLYGGRAQAREEDALTELGQSFLREDIGLRQQGAQQALQYAMPSIQQLYPQTTYPGAPTQQQPVSQPVTPSADALYNAIYQASQPQNFPGTERSLLSWII